MRRVSKLNVTPGRFVPAYTCLANLQARFASVQETNVPLRYARNFPAIINYFTLVYFQRLISTIYRGDNLRRLITDTRFHSFFLDFFVKRESLGNDSIESLLRSKKMVSLRWVVHFRKVDRVFFLFQ